MKPSIFKFQLGSIFYNNNNECIGRHIGMVSEIP